MSVNEGETTLVFVSEGETTLVSVIEGGNNVGVCY